MAQRVRRRQDDHRAARPPDSPLRHRGNRQRQLALQKPRRRSRSPRSHRLRNPDQLRRRERYRQNPSPKGVKIGRRCGAKFERRLTIRDRVVQGALKLILEPVFEADFQPGSFGYRPKRTAHDAIKRVADAIVQRKTRVLDFDLRAYFDNVRHDRLLEKVAQRVDDADIMHLLKVILRASGKKGVPQGGVISPLLSNLYLNEVDRMLERAREITRKGKSTHVKYASSADAMVILKNAH